MNKKLIIIIIVVVILALGGGVAAVMLLGNNKEEKPKEPEKMEFELGEKMGNLSPEPDSKKSKAPIIKYNAVIVYTGEETLELLNKNKTLISNEFSKYFVTKAISQVRRQERVQEDLTDIVREIMGDSSDSVIDVLFKEITWQ